MTEQAKKRDAMIGNNYAAKEITKDSTLYIRVTKEQKAAYCNAANGEPLSAWITKTLDNKVKSLS
ncbi:MAG: hypothetical protein PHD53_00075 [Methylococcales bacterium]|nr:hypothetical protein [Methylococcales bacterium]